MITGCPSNVKFDGVVSETMPDDLVDEPLVIIGHTEVVEVLTFPARESNLVVRLMGPKQRAMEFRMDATGH